MKPQRFLERQSIVPKQTWVRQFFRFGSTQAWKILIAIRLMTHNGFQDLIQNNSRLEMAFCNLIEIDSQLK